MTTPSLPTETPITELINNNIGFTIFFAILLSVAIFGAVYNDEWKR